MNKIILMGNLAKDPDVRYTQSGKAFMRTSIAINRYAKKGEKPETNFFNLVAWEKTAEFCGKYLTKGSRVLVEGRLQTYSYEVKDGVKRSGVEIWIDNIEFAGSKSDKKSDETRGEFDGEPVADDDMPF